MSKLSVSVRLARQACRLTQAELAGLMGCRRATVLHWEKGHHKPLPLYLEKLERVLGSKLDDGGAER